MYQLPIELITAPEERPIVVDVESWSSVELHCDEARMVGCQSLQSTNGEMYCPINCRTYMAVLARPTKVPCRSQEEVSACI
jgi:hypothetical protein